VKLLDVGFDLLAPFQEACAVLSDLWMDRKKLNRRTGRRNGNDD